MAVFDTAFHHTPPTHASTYAIPKLWTWQYGIRRFGFHGIAHASLAENYARHTHRSLKELRLITFQLGHGCSATAIDHGGFSVETSMGFSPLEGLVMGTRRVIWIRRDCVLSRREDPSFSLNDLSHQLNTQLGY
ncbi:MAG: hypothetical protein R3B83_02700 [Nitrospirales bacterium]|nr:hypothetical protein [Nitrospirales bacterium]